MSRTVYVVLEVSMKDGTSWVDEASVGEAVFDALMADEVELPAVLLSIDGWEVRHGTTVVVRDVPQPAENKGEDT